MQIQTTIVTTETVPVQNVNFQITTFEQTIAVFCDCCDSQASGTKEELKLLGWSFLNGSEFCPRCR